MPPEKDIIDEIEEIAEVKAKEVVDAIPPVEFPTSIEVSNFPEPPQTHEIDLSGLETALKALLDKKAPEMPVTNLETVEGLLEGLIAIEQPDNTTVLNSILKAVDTPKRIDFSDVLDEFRELVDEVKRIKERPIQRGGGGISSRREIRNAAGRIINPSIAVSDGETLSTADPQGTVIVGKRDVALGRQIAEYIGVAGIKTDALKVLDENNHILKEVVRLLKANNSHQEILTDTKFDGTE